MTAVFKAFGKMPDWRELLSISSISRPLGTVLRRLVGKSRQQVDELKSETISSSVLSSMGLNCVIPTKLLL